MSTFVKYITKISYLSKNTEKYRFIHPFIQKTVQSIGIEKSEELYKELHLKLKELNDSVHRDQDKGIPHPDLALVQVEIDLLQKRIDKIESLAKEEYRNCVAKSYTPINWLDQILD